MDTNKIGEFLKSLRKVKGLTQQQVADALYVSHKTVSRWENGEGIPDINIITSVADFYDVTVDELLRGERKTLKEEKLTEQTIYLKNKSKLKLLGNKLSSKLNIYFWVSNGIQLLFFILAIIFMIRYGPLLLFLILIGNLISLFIYLYGYSEIKKYSLDDEEINSIDGFHEIKKRIRDKNILYADITFVLLVLFIISFSFWLAS